MLNFILNTIVLLSLGIIIYLFARALPRVNDADGEVKPLRPHWLTVYLEKTDVWLDARSEKILRRLKIWVLKLDNWVSQKLNKFKKAEPKETIIPLENNGGDEKNQNSV